MCLVLRKTILGIAYLRRVEKIFCVWKKNFVPESQGLEIGRENSILLCGSLFAGIHKMH